MTQLIDLADDPAAVRVRKRPLEHSVRFAEEAGLCETLEGPVHYDAGDAIVTGSEGERWPVARAAFLASYRPKPPAGPGDEGTYVSRGEEALALRLIEARSVRPHKRGGALRGDSGDWLVQYPNGNHGIVRADIFAATYDIVPRGTPRSKR